MPFSECGVLYVLHIIDAVCLLTCSLRVHNENIAHNNIFKTVHIQHTYKGNTYIIKYIDNTHTNVGHMYVYNNMSAECDICICVFIQYIYKDNLGIQYTYKDSIYIKYTP